MMNVRMLVKLGADVLPLILSSLLAIVSLPAQAHAVLLGRIVSVSGGDVLTLVDSENREHKLRLAYLDAPALGQPFGDEAQSSLAAMVFNRVVKAQVYGPHTDGRLLAEVFTDNGKNVGLELLSRGLAWHDYLERQGAAERDHYRTTSMEAQRDRRGIWAFDRLEAPRDYRERFARAIRWWTYVIAACAALVAVAATFAIYGPRIESWLAKQEELERVRAEDYRLARATIEAEAKERERTREIADQEMDRLAAERRMREHSAEVASTRLPPGPFG